jgi:hypothetical protein
MSSKHSEEMEYKRKEMESQKNKYQEEMSAT